MKRNRLWLMLLLIFTSALISGCGEISEEKALSAAQEFVDSTVRFYARSNETGNSTDIQRARIQVTNVYKTGNEWNIEMHIYSNATGEEKKSGLLVVVDASTGMVKKDKLGQFIIG